MRVNGNDSAFELGFECGGAGIKRTEFPGLNFLRLEALSVSLQKSANGTINVAAGVNILGVNIEGSVIARVGPNSPVVICPARSMFFVRGPIRMSALAARGEHRLQMLSWHSQAIPALDHWLHGHGINRTSRGMARNFGSKPIDPHFRESLKRFEEAKTNGSDATEPLLISVIYEAVGRIMLGPDQMQLSPVPVDLPDSLSRLSEAVRKKPSSNWSLKEASAMASYSPFHFSRVFKQLVGYGFHEYVDRCRTEHAVTLLVSSDLSVDHVATQAGFGTTQSLREAVREYVGLVPSEFRTLPEMFETTGV